MAAVEVVESNLPPPAELQIRWLCEQWGALPDNGGLNDQDYRTIYISTKLDSVYSALSKLRRAVGKEIHQLTDPERRLIRYLMREGIIDG